MGFILFSGEQRNQRKISSGGNKKTRKSVKPKSIIRESFLVDPMGNYLKSQKKPKTNSNKGQLKYSSDGKYVAWSEFKPGKSPKLLLHWKNLKTKKVKKIKDESIYHFSWTFDGKEMVYSKALEIEGKRRSTLFALDPTTGKERRLLSDSRQVYAPKCSPIKNEIRQGNP